MPFPILPVLGGLLAGGLLSGSRGQKTEAKSVPTLDPQQKIISEQLQPRLSQRLGYPSEGAGQGTQPFGAQLEDPAIAALQRALAVDPRFAATYGMMGLRAIQAATAAVPVAQSVWQEPYQMAQQYLQNPQMATYLEQPAPNPLIQLLGAVSPILGGYFAGGGNLGGLLGQTTTPELPQLSAQARGSGSMQYPYY